MYLPSRTRLAAMRIAAGLLIVGTLALAAPATASGGGETGYLLIHGVGSAFTIGNGSVNSIAVNAGGVATFTFEVKNTGTATAQFNLSINDIGLSCNPGCTVPTQTVTTGSLVVTTLTRGDNGYFTPPIAAGKTATFTLKSTVAAGTPAGDVFVQQIRLRDTAYNDLDEAVATDVVTTTAKGTGAGDEYVTGSGSQKAVGDPQLFGGFVTDPTVKLGASATYTVKLENDSTETLPIQYQLNDPWGCSPSFPATVKAGTTDVTAAALAGTYMTPSLAPGKSVSLTVSVKYASLVSPCPKIPGSDWWQSKATANGVTQMVTLITNTAGS